MAWLFDCLNSHSGCQFQSSHNYAQAPLPRRLLEITVVEEQVKARLCEVINPCESVHYMTLSHCWGKAPIWCLLKENYKLCVENIPLSRLAPVFRDAMSVVIKARVSYLWIDSLCIIQDDPEDWARESARMGGIYRGAICNIAATGFPNGSSGLFPRRDLRAIKPVHVCLDHPLKFENDDTVKSQFYLADYDLWQKGVETAPLNTRAWVIQERCLSPRVLHFGSQQLFWECMDLRASEMFFRGIPSHIPIFNFKCFRIPSVINIEEQSVDGIPHMQQRWQTQDSKPSIEPSPLPSKIKYWWTIVEAYTRTTRSVTSDKLVAISGIAKVLQPYFKSRYLAGLWESNLPRGLLWSVDKDQIKSVVLGPTEYLAPSWSWAGLDHPTTMPPGVWGGDVYNTTTFAEVLECGIMLKTHDEHGAVLSGRLRIAGPLCLTSTNRLPPRAFCQRVLIHLQMDIGADHVAMNVCTSLGGELALEHMTVFCMPVLPSRL
jgi:hypothetical protein